METIYRSAPAKMGPPATSLAGTLYLTDTRLVFFPEAQAPVVKDGAEVDWSGKTPAWELTLAKLRNAKAKTTLYGPSLLIADDQGRDTGFVLKDPRAWTGAIQARR